MHKEDRKKIVKAGMRIFQKDEVLLVIREATAGYRWQVRYRARSLEALRATFNKLINDPRAVRG